MGFLSNKIWVRIFLSHPVYRIAPLTLGTLHWVCICMVGQLHALNAQQNRHLLSVEFS